MRKKYYFISLLLILVFMFSGCSKEDIYNVDEKKELTAIDAGDMEEDIYYVKDGTKFYRVYKPEKSFESDTSKPNPETRYIWNLESEDGLIPTLYKNESICFYSQKKSFDTVPVLERFFDLGFSVGVVELKKQENGYVNFERTKNVREKSSMASLVGKVVDSTSTINISTMDGKEIENLTRCGSIQGLEKDKTYNFDFFIGTLHGNGEVKADVHFYQSGEVLKLENSVSNTVKSYAQIALPENLKTGYYMLDGYGMFRYINDTKAEVQKSYDFNVPNNIQGMAYAIGDLTMDSVNEITFYTDYEEYNNMTVTITGGTGAEIESATLIEPSGEEHPVTIKKNKGTLRLTEGKGGKCIVQLTGKNLNQVDVSHKENKKKETPTPTPTSTPTPKPTKKATPTPTKEPTPKPTKEPTPEPTEEPQQQTEEPQQQITTYTEPQQIITYEYQDTPDTSGDSSYSEPSNPLNGVESSGTMSD